MNINEIKNIVRHLVKNSSCPKCKAKYNTTNINILASTNIEALFELKCTDCNSTGIANVVLTPETETQIEFETTDSPREHRQISSDEVLDIKNFLSHFDGNFKKIFSKKK